MTDELAKRRTERPNGSLLTEKESRAAYVKGGPMPLWQWFSGQTAHSVTIRAEAAKHVSGRFNLAYTRFSHIDRALTKEDSEHLIGFRELLDEYRALFNIEDDDSEFARQTGVGGKMLPFAPEVCENCHRPAIPGTGRCQRHGGQWVSEKDMADMSRILRERVLQMSMSALRVLQDLMDNAKSEQVRSQAAAMILDRAGIGAHVNVNHSGLVTIESSDEAMVSIHNRLSALALNLEQRAELEARISTPVDGLGDIIDAEVVEDPTPMRAHRVKAQ